jgi:hypothetical protein
MCGLDYEELYTSSMTVAYFREQVNVIIKPYTQNF